MGAGCCWWGLTGTAAAGRCCWPGQRCRRGSPGLTASATAAAHDKCGCVYITPTHTASLFPHTHPPSHTQTPPSTHPNTLLSVQHPHPPVIKAFTVSPSCLSSCSLSLTTSTVWKDWPQPSTCSRRGGVEGCVGKTFVGTAAAAAAVVTHCKGLLLCPASCASNCSQ